VKRIISISVLILVAGLSACEKPPAAPATPPAAGQKKSTEHPAHGGDAIDLGTTTIGGLTVRAARDKDPIKPGAETHIDIVLSNPAGQSTKTAAVRVWIGTEDAKGSVKSKAEIEDPKEPGRLHAHADVPDPIPTDSKLWVEIENETGGRSVGSFPLKT
jgi:hypothetical protein